MSLELHNFSLDRVVNAVERVRQRLMRATAALQVANVPYAVAGGNAVALWVSRVDEAAVRNTQDVDILIRRDSLTAAKTALEQAGFVYRHIAGMDVFLDGPSATLRDAVHLIFASEKVAPPSRSQIRMSNNLNKLKISASCLSMHLFKSN